MTGPNRTLSVAIVVVGVVGLLTAWQMTRSSASEEAKPALVNTEMPIAYEEYWETVLEVSADPTVPLERLDEVTRGPQLRNLRSGLDASRSMGQVTLGEVSHDILQVEVVDGRQYVVDCLDLSGWLLADAATGASVPDQSTNPPGEVYQFTMVKKDGQWYVTDSTSIGLCESP